jgi:DnaJ-domain-containing protein 1/ketosteroid isomerase-like protein
MSRPAQRSRKASDPEEDGCSRLLEVLAQSDPVPDTSSLCLERKELLSLLAEISKGQQSEFLLQITHLAQRRGVLPQEIAARAGSLLACLEAPGSDDYYQILGAAPTATPQEIRDAWIGRVSIYHPDRHPEKADWFTHQVARLNEAYHMLKDPGRRQEYDERRRENLERQRRDSSALLHQAGEPRKPSSLGGWMRRRLPTIITGGSVIAASLIVAALFLSRPPNRPEATLFTPSKTPAPEPTLEASSSDDVGSIEQPPVRRQKPQPQRSGVRRQPLSERPALPAPPDLQKISKLPGQRVMTAQALPPLAPEPKSLDRQEIDALLDEYVDAYEKGDVDRLMATFSPKILEKGTLDYQAIRSLYAKGFAGREQIIYRIKNVQVQIKGDNATVTAQYLVSAKNATQSQKGVTVSGQIEWKIQREGDKPRIIALNY